VEVIQSSFTNAEMKKKQTMVLRAHSLRHEIQTIQVDVPGASSSESNIAAGDDLHGFVGWRRKIMVRPFRQHWI
jgi:hypothetical protein